jgi:hypothetical protein
VKSHLQREQRGLHNKRTNKYQYSRWMHKANANTNRPCLRDPLKFAHWQALIFYVFCSNSLLTIFISVYFKWIKGVWHEIFWRQAFFTDQFPPWSWVVRNWFYSPLKMVSIDSTIKGIWRIRRTKLTVAGEDLKVH